MLENSPTSMPMKDSMKLSFFLLGRCANTCGVSGRERSQSTSSIVSFLARRERRTAITFVPSALNRAFSFVRGSAPAVTALVGGQIDMIFADLALLAPHAKAGTLRLIAAAGARRAPAGPELLTVAEQGIPGVAIEPWYGVVAPAGTPDAIVKKLNTTLNEGLQTAEMKDTIAKLGAISPLGSPEDFSKFIMAQFRKWQAIAKAANIKID